MPTKQYLDRDINKLFEEHNVKDIEKIQKTIQLECDRKKIELRTLVGERYRDLIQAADTIAEMRQTSENVILRIADIETTFRNLQEKYLIGFKVDNADGSRDRESQNVSDSVVMQIKVLMDIPEHIWSAIDNRDLLLASQLFILAQHVNYSLTFEVGQSTLSKKYPIVAKQWSIIGHFRNVIFNECNDTLRSMDLSAKAAANCLAALVLMDGTSSKDLLEKLISSRCQAIESIIKDESPHSVRHRIKLSVKLLTDTVTLIYSCFIKINEHSRGLVAENVMHLTDQQASEMLYNLDLDNDLLKKFLPTVTKVHKPFEKGNFVDLSSTDLNDILDNWYGWIDKFTSMEIFKLLNLVTSVRGIYNIREESLSVVLPENWEKITAELSLPTTNFWSSFYQPLLTTRVKSIIREKWEESVKTLKNDIADLLMKINNEKYEFSESDLRWYVWKDSPIDIPQKLTKIMALDGKRSLLMKARGYSPNLVKLCENFDANLNLLLADLEQYLYDNEISRTTNLLVMNFFTIFDKFTDRTEIQENLQETSASMIESLVNFIKNEYIVDKEKSSNCHVSAILIARFLQAITSICPSLNKCFTMSKISGLQMTNVKWQNMCDRLRDESTLIWSIWANYYKRKITNNCEKYFHDEKKGDYRIGEIICEWERVTIEEEAEEGKSIKSEILVPYQASVKLQNFLSTVTKDLNKIIPHTMPKKVIHEIVDHIVVELFDHYNVTANNPNIRQKYAFQILFDIKYITMLMVPRENKILTDRSAQVSNNVLAKIDPFDSDVFYPFIHVNVKKSAQRSLLIFGNLVPHIEQLHSILGSRSDYTSSDGSKSMADPPGGLAICTGAPWFPPLAVTAPTRNLPLMPVSIPDKAQRKKTPVKEVSKNDFSGATIKSGAAAFFGAMGSDWFGTN